MYFLVLQEESSLLGLYGPVLRHLLGNTGKYSPSCQTNMENQLFQYWPTSKNNTGHLCFKQAQPKMCHSPKVDDGVDIFFKTSCKPNFGPFFLEEL